MHVVGTAGVRALVPDPAAVGAAGDRKGGDNEAQNQETCPHFISLAL